MKTAANAVGGGLPVVEPVLAEGDERQVVAELARLIVEECVPEELPFFDEASSGFFEDPDACRERAPEEGLGFGLELALLTPVLLGVMTTVVRFVASILTEAAVMESRSRLATVVARLFGLRRPHDGSAPPLLTVSDARAVRDVAFEGLASAGIKAREAGLIADAIVGRLCTGSE